MASTYSNLKIQLMATGENSGTWGNVTNVNLGTALEQAIVETATIDVSGGDATLSLSDSNARQDARALRLNVTGASVARVVNVPAIEKPYLVNNAGSAAVTVKVSGQTGIAVPAGKTMWVYNNGTDVVDALTHLTSLTLASPLGVPSGGTGANTLTANSAILGNGTSAVQFVAPGTSGNILTSNGTTWASTAPAAQGFDSGTVMLFAQTAAPTGWTKDTSNYNNSGLRVVTGTASTGGSVDFTTAFASQTPTGSVTITSVSGSAGATTLSTPQIPSHSHPITRGGAYSGTAGFQTANPVGTGSSGSAGGGGSHTHPFSFSSGSGTFSGSAINLAVKYVDVIRASKD